MDFVMFRRFRIRCRIEKSTIIQLKKKTLQQSILATRINKAGL